MQEAGDINTCLLYTSRDVYFNVHKKILEETRHPELKSTHDWMFNLYVASPDK